MMKSTGLYSGLKLFHRVRHVGVVLDNGYRVELFISKLMRKVCCTVWVNWALFNRSLLIITLGIFKYYSVINFRTISHGDISCFNPFTVTLSGAVIVNIVAVYGLC
ncbi:Uncharacterised protein [Klebsiella pneumoniae]|nr:Uncharacterised protein [Klebsiella pneumoniae]